MSHGRLTYFVGDLHLGSPCSRGVRATERMAVAWLEKIAPTCGRLVLMGDVLDYWFEYRTVVPRGFVRFFGALARLADDGVEILWLKGNHDMWMRDYLSREIGIRIIDGVLLTEIDGHTFFLEHGDGVGRIPTGFKVLRSVFRSPLARWLYASVHPRWTVGLAHTWSNSRKDENAVEPSDAEILAPLVEFSTEHAAAHPDVDFYVFGHYHRLLLEKLPSGATLAVLGDWMQRPSYAVFDGEKLSLFALNDDLSEICLNK